MSTEDTIVAAECLKVARDSLARTDTAIAQTARAIDLALESLQLARQWQERALKAEGKLDKAISTGPGDLDVCGRELKPGS